MNEIEPKIRQEVLFQNEIRSEWRDHDTPQQLEAFILEETQELSEAVEKAMIGDGAFEVASEVGDIFYLYIKRMSASPEPLPDEVQAGVDYAAYIAGLGELDINQCIFMKIIRNDLKYAQTISNNGYGYEQSKQLSKQQWKYMGGDSKFSEMYLEMGEDLK